MYNDFLEYKNQFCAELWQLQGLIITSCEVMWPPEKDGVAVYLKAFTLCILADCYLKCQTSVMSALMSFTHYLKHLNFVIWLNKPWCFRVLLVGYLELRSVYIWQVNCLFHDCLMMQENCIPRLIWSFALKRFSR